MPGLKHSPVILQSLSGGTTVSATMIAAHRAGIHVFVTGGIGGVHRDGENSEQTGDQRTASDHWISIKNPDFFPHSSGHQRRPHGARQDSRCSGFCWSQVHSGHWPHP